MSNMTLVQMENGIRLLPQQEQLQLLSWLAEYIRERFMTVETSTPESKTDVLPEKVRLEDIDHPLNGTLLKYEDPFEPIAVEDWHVLQ